MESEHAAQEQANFSGLRCSQQTDAAQNITPGGDKVAWINAERGRILGPSSSQQIFAGDRLHLRVHGKYSGENGPIWV